MGVLSFVVRLKLEGIGILMPDLNVDGRAGWRWHFWQGLWYRWIVDREIGRGMRSGSEER